MKDAAICLESGGKWLNSFQNFDTVGHAMVTLVEIATTESWVDVMHSGVDAVGIFSGGLIGSGRKCFHRDYSCRNYHL